MHVIIKKIKRINLLLYLTKKFIKYNFKIQNKK